MPNSVRTIVKKCLYKGAITQEEHDKIIRKLDSSEQKGHWIEKKVFDIEDSKQIEQWQSCRCSECGRYDTRPFLYYFNRPHFCSWCGADMRGEEE